MQDGNNVICHQDFLCLLMSLSSSLLRVLADSMGISYIHVQKQGNHMMELLAQSGTCGIIIICNTDVLQASKRIKLRI